MKYECRSCGAIAENLDYTYENETGTCFALCRTCGSGHYHPIELISKTADKAEVFENLVPVIMYLNSLREEYEVMKKNFEAQLSMTENAVREMFDKLVDIDASWAFDKALNERYEQASSESTANRLLKMLEDRMSC